MALQAKAYLPALPGGVTPDSLQTRQEDSVAPGLSFASPHLPAPIAEIERDWLAS